MNPRKASKHGRPIAAAKSTATHVLASLIAREPSERPRIDTLAIHVPAHLIACDRSRSCAHAHLVACEPSESCSNQWVSLVTTKTPTQASYNLADKETQAKEQEHWQEQCEGRQFVRSRAAAFRSAATVTIIAAAGVRLVARLRITAF